MCNIKVKPYLNSEPISRKLMSTSAMASGGPGALPGNIPVPPAASSRACSNSTATSIFVPNFNAGQLLHLVQRERGSSCGWTSSKGTIAELGDWLQNFRAATDDFLQQLHDHSASNIKLQIKQARAAVDEAVRGDTPVHDMGPLFYKVLLDYNAICSTLVELERARVISLHGDTPLVKTSMHLICMKEGVAQTRGWLTGICALSIEGLAKLPNSALAHIVICMHQQRVEQTLLHDGAPSSALEIVEPCFQIDSEELSNIHWKLESQLSLLELRSTVSVLRCWSLYSEYVDKLHHAASEIEKLIVQETQADKMDRERASLVLHYFSDMVSKQLHLPKLELTNLLDAKIRQQNESGTNPSSNTGTAFTSISDIGPGNRGAALAEKASAAGSTSADILECIQDIITRTPAEMLKASVLDMLRSIEIRNNQTSGSGAAGFDDIEEETSEAADSVTSAGVCGSHAEAKEELVASNLLIEKDEIELERLLGHNTAGMAYEAKWQGAEVLVKMPNTSLTELESWRSEVRTLSILHHPNVVSLLGVVFAPPTYCLVLEAFEATTVRTALDSATPPGFFWTVAKAAAKIVAYLHHKDILHRDLTTTSLLVNEAGVVKLTDFGLAVKLLPGAKCASGFRTSTFRYMAPEIVRRQNCTKEAEVYSFGLILSELITHSVPFAKHEMSDFASAVVLYGRRPYLPVDTPKRLAELIHKCWNHIPARRPKIEALKKDLSELHASLTKVELFWLDDANGHPLACNTNTSAHDDFTGRFAGLM